ncbi:MAG: helix-turn-helix transcriptional regulator [Clostridiales bacterium]|jgi:transcriptional regulator with XRE-family HTH domain|nr:helix-turn-helix transcriptional regulator [Clostridiales bacterium]
MDQQKIGSFLKSLRKEKGITQEKLAEELGVSGRTVSRWETGNNMPDISVLIEISEFYDVSIPEIVDGERKSENMDDESKKVAESLSDYADADKTKTIKEIRQLSLVGVAALAIYFIIDVSGYAGAYDIADRISAYCLTLVFVTTILIPLFTTGIIKRIQWKDKIQNKLNIPKPVMMVVLAGLAFILAAIIKLGLIQLFPTL